MDINEAKKVLKDNGYIVVKVSKDMEKAMDECDGSDPEQCLGCPCNICLLTDC